MHDDNGTPPADFISEGVSNYTPPSYDIPEEHAERVERIQNYDPVYGVPGPVSGDIHALSKISGVQSLADLTSESLGPELQSRVAERMQQAPPISQSAAIEEVLYQHAYETNVFSGPGENATPFQREDFAIVREAADVEMRMFQIELEFLKAIEWSNEVDERTGASAPKQRDLMHPETRRQLEFERDELRHRFNLLTGIEGHRRRQKATLETIALEEAREREAQMLAEVERRSDEIIREEQVEERARALAKMKRTER